MLVALFAVNVYRAATLAISREEAYDFDRFIRPPIRDVLAHYDSRNQLLNTFLVKRSIGLLRLSEFSFRLPGLMGTALCFWAVYRISRRLSGSWWLRLAAVAILVLNPFVLDHLWVARGDAIALGLCMWALELMLDYLQAGQPLTLRNLNLAGLFLGLAAAASLAFALPALALAAAFLVVTGWQHRLSWVVGMQRIVVTAVAVAFILLAIPLSRADDVRLFDFHFRSYAERSDESGFRTMVNVLRRAAGEGKVRIVASPDARLRLEFYKERYRLRSWEVVQDVGQFYVFSNGVTYRHFEVLYHDAAFTVAR